MRPWHHDQHGLSAWMRVQDWGTSGTARSIVNDISSRNGFWGQIWRVRTLEENERERVWPKRKDFSRLRHRKEGNTSRPKSPPWEVRSQKLRQVFWGEATKRTVALGSIRGLKMKKTKCKKTSGSRQWTKVSHCVKATLSLLPLPHDKARPRFYRANARLGRGSFHVTGPSRLPSYHEASPHFGSEWFTDNENYNTVILHASSEYFVPYTP